MRCGVMRRARFPAGSRGLPRSSSAELPTPTVPDGSCRPTGPFFGAGTFCFAFCAKITEKRGKHGTTRKNKDSDARKRNERKKPKKTAKKRQPKSRSKAKNGGHALALHGNFTNPCKFSFADCFPGLSVGKKNSRKKTHNETHMRSTTSSSVSTFESHSQASSKISKIIAPLALKIAQPRYFLRVRHPRKYFVVIFHGSMITHSRDKRRMVTHL